jgi:hypothetical protein
MSALKLPVSVAFMSTLASDGATLAGQWQQGGQSPTLDFRRRLPLP